MARDMGSIMQAAAKLNTPASWASQYLLSSSRMRLYLPTFPQVLIFGKEVASEPVVNQEQYKTSVKHNQSYLRL